MFEIFSELVEGLKVQYPSLGPYFSKYWLAIIFLGVMILGYIIKLLKKFYNVYVNYTYQKDLHPYFTVKQVFDATDYYIPTNYQNVSPSEDEEPSRDFIASAKNELMPLFLKTLFKFNGDNNKYYLILADSGMGKSTFMINLFLAYKRKFIFGKRFDIKLLPLGSPHIWDDIDKIPDENKANTILLLDAFDEDNEAIVDYKKRMAFVLSKVWRFREVVITCRTQFFPRQIDETAGYEVFPDGSGQTYKFQKLYLSVFSTKDIRKYLSKKYKLYNPYNWSKRRKAYRITKKSPSLMVRPMLLSYIDDFIGHKQPLEDLEDIYRILVDKWIERESNKAGIIEKYGSSKNYKERLYKFSTDFALDLFLNRKRRGGFFMPSGEVFNPKNSLDIKDIEQEFIESADQKSRSLLNRNALGDYKFSHKSIFEYFLYLNIIDNNISLYKFEFDGLDILKIFIGKQAALFLVRYLMVAKESIALYIFGGPIDLEFDPGPLLSTKNFSELITFKHISDPKKLAFIHTLEIDAEIMEQNLGFEFMQKEQAKLLRHISFFSMLPNLKAIIYTSLFEKKHFISSPTNHQFDFDSLSDTSRDQTFLGSKIAEGTHQDSVNIIKVNEKAIVSYLKDMKDKYTIVIYPGAYQ